MDDTINRQSTIDTIHKTICGFFDVAEDDSEEPISEKDKLLLEVNKVIRNEIKELPSSQPQDIARDIATIIENEKDMRVVLKNAQDHKDKYEYHYDHTDCIWYRPEARNRCPVTCAQYRDGWNDAMNYIFHDGKGYRPYRRDKKYEERREE